MNSSRSSVLIFILLLITTQRITAQYSDSMGYRGWNNPLSAQASTMLWSSLIYRTPQDYKNGTISSGVPSTTTRAAQPPSQSQTQAKPVDDSSVKFRSTGSYIRTGALADQLGNTPAEREQYLKLMNGVLDLFGKKAQAAGLKNDVALALSYFLGENVRIYRGLPELADAQYVEMRNVIAETLAATGALNNSTDRQKQEFYEALVAYTGITQYGYEQGVQAKNDAIIKGYQKVAAQNLQTVTTISPDSINIGGDNSQVQPPITATGDVVKIGRPRSDYSENEVRADQLYKGKRFVFSGIVTDVSGNYYKTTGTDPVGRPIITNLGTNLRVSDAGVVIGFEVHCFFKDNSQLGQLRGQQRIAFEATVQGREEGGSNLILVDGVLR